MTKIGVLLLALCAVAAAPAFAQSYDRNRGDYSEAPGQYTDGYWHSRPDGDSVYPNDPYNGQALSLVYREPFVIGPSCTPRPHPYVGY